MKRLNVFDFDDTLIRVIGPGSYPAIKDKVDLPFTEEDIEKSRFVWWQHPISLSQKFFAFNAIIPVYKMYLECARDTDAINILITSRAPNVLPEIQAVLDGFGIKFHQYYAGGGEPEIKKKDFLDMAIDKCLRAHGKDSISKIVIYEDTMSNIIDLTKHIKDHHGIGYDVIFVNNILTHEIEKFDVDEDGTVTFKIRRNHHNFLTTKNLKHDYIL